ncbi:MAG: glycosyltransferase family 2 protein [Rhodothermales bacterium]
MKASVLIATRDRPQSLRRCLAGVARQDVPPLEVLILDDASSTPLDEEAVRRAVAGLPVRFLRSEERLGPAGCRNRLMQQARSDLFILLDDDACFADPSGIRNTIAAFEQNPEAGILAFKLIEKNPGQEGLLVPHGRRRLRRQPHLANKEGLVTHYLAGGHAVQRTVIERCGYFPPDLCYGHEELDLSYRALDAGFTILYLPSVVVHHFRDEATAPAWPWKIYHLTRNRIRIAFTYLPMPYMPVHIGCWVLWYGLYALRHRALRAFGRGLRAGLSSLKRSPRCPLRARTIAYLKAHHGRLWY